MSAVITADRIKIPMALTLRAFDGPTPAELDHALGLLHLGDGAYDKAFIALRRSCADERAPTVAALVDLVEAAVRCGRRSEAQRAGDDFAVLAGQVGGALPSGLCSRVSALLDVDLRAEAHYRRSLRLLEEAGDEFAAARTSLVYGEWLRRHHRRREARANLTFALRVFESQPTASFATRALDELLAAGEPGVHPGSDAVADLTPRENQIVREVASGQTNREIAARLHLSPATVDYHLRKVFQKLGIASRRQLRALARTESEHRSPAHPSGAHPHASVALR